MPSSPIKITLTTTVKPTARALQCASLFDVDPTQKLTRTWEHNLYEHERPWQIGLIVGPSGSGKSTLAKHLWPDQLTQTHKWPNDKAIIDGFPQTATIKDITNTLTQVGLGSTPAWLRPYNQLSNGEQFRADIAHALTQPTPLTIIDEFTSVVDRQVARVTAHCIQKTIRKNPTKQFVAITCHYDVTDWLQPDWIYDLQTCQFKWRLVQPHPPLELRIRKATTREWPIFSHHHYLTNAISNSARCYIAEIDNQPVAFTSYTHFPHPKARNIKMAHRIVVLPDYQGLGIARELSNWQGQQLAEQNYRYHITTAHPGMKAMLERSPRWRRVSTRQSSPGTRSNIDRAKFMRTTRRHTLASYAYQKPHLPK